MTGHAKVGGGKSKMDSKGKLVSDYLRFCRSF